MKNMFKKIQPTVMLTWGKIKKVGTTVKLAIVYFNVIR